MTSAERDPSTCALTSASGRSLQYNDRKKRTKKPKMKVFRNLRHATHSQYKLWWLPILTRESDLSNRCGIAHYGYISARNMMNNYKQQHEREQQRTEQEWNMSDQRSQDRNGKLIDSYAAYRLQLHFILLEALVKPLSFWHQKKSKSINSVLNNPYLGNCLETSYFWGPKRKAASKGKLGQVVQIDVCSFMI